MSEIQERNRQIARIAYSKGVSQEYLQQALGQADRFGCLITQPLLAWGIINNAQAEALLRWSAPQQPRFVMPGWSPETALNETLREQQAPPETTIRLAPPGGAQPDPSSDPRYHLTDTRSEQAEPAGLPPQPSFDPTIRLPAPKDPGFQDSDTFRDDLNKHLDQPPSRGGFDAPSGELIAADFDPTVRLGKDEEGGISNVLQNMQGYKPRGRRPPANWSANNSGSSSNAALNVPQAPRPASPGPGSFDPTIRFPPSPSSSAHGLDDTIREDAPGS